MSKYKKRGERSDKVYTQDDLNDNWILDDDSSEESNNDSFLSDVLPKKKSNKPPKVYWTEDTEEAIVEYLNLDYEFLNNQIEKEIKSNNPDYKLIDFFKGKIKETENISSNIKKQKIFRERINKPLRRLVENIIFSFKLFRRDYDIVSLQEDCMSFILTKFANFDPGVNAKAYSFFGTIAKHYLMGGVKEFYKISKSNINYEDAKDEADEREVVEIDDENELETSLNLFNFIINEIEEEIENGNMSENDIKVADAIIKIFKHHDIIGHYNKNQLYLDIKEATRLETKDITYSLTRLRVFYKLKKQFFIKGLNR